MKLVFKRKVFFAGLSVAALSACMVGGLPASAQALSVVNTSAYYGVYDGEAHPLDSAKISGAYTHEVYYSTTTALTKDNYKTKGTKTAPTRTKTGTTKVYVLYKYKAERGDRYTYLSQSSTINVLMPPVKEKDYIGAYDGKAHSANVACADKSCKVYYSTSKITFSNYKKVGSTKALKRTKVGTTAVRYLVVPSGATAQDQCASGSLTLKVSRPSISDCVVSGIADSYTYTGEAVTPVPAVSCSGVALKQGRDYTVSYYDNRVCGTATLIIKGKGNYSGSAEIHYQITPLQLAACDISGVETQVLKLVGKEGVITKPSDLDPAVVAGYKFYPKPTVSWQGKTFYEDEYDVSWENNSADNLFGWVILTGKGNLTGTVRLPYLIEIQVDLPADAEAAQVK